METAGKCWKYDGGWQTQHNHWAKLCWIQKNWTWTTNYVQQCHCQECVFEYISIMKCNLGDGYKVWDQCFQPWSFGDFVHYPGNKSAAETFFHNIDGFLCEARIHSLIDLYDQEGIQTLMKAVVYLSFIIVINLCLQIKEFLANFLYFILLLLDSVISLIYVSWYFKSSNFGVEIK